ncbi:DddA-like double-stranded DNA deaminase toxin [Lentzea sp. HUAS12]|uniref:DddA-like double-stranded DNA deaminase toxin n=1 Tax=Lentzea sp. HUAS12 TaxID=2951806 RepID=UPI0020A0C1F5|nr:DddA-like double-stranded DNA deaminase toxin [Lentzea sp. HUAS12]USX49199.1 hypothetical protein ND450_27595 [Lentzea sp. HUAS12]
MASLREVGDGLNSVLDKAADAGAALQVAAELAEDAQQLLMSAAGGSAQADVETTNAHFAEVVGGVAGLHRFLGAGISSVESMLHRLGLAVDTPSAEAVGTRPERGSRDHVEQLRRGQPPPVQPRSGQRTHGSWFANADEPIRELTSGEDEWYEVAKQHLKERGVPATPVTAVDVEIKLAVHMARNNIQHATVVLNNTPCKGRFGCDALVPVVLPEGSTLTVHGITPDGRIMRKTYSGGAPAPWS